MRQRFWQWVYWRIVALDDYSCYRIGQASRWVYNNHLQSEAEKAEARTFLELFNRPGPVTCRPMRIPFTILPPSGDGEQPPAC